MMIGVYVGRMMAGSVRWKEKWFVKMKGGRCGVQM